MESDVEIPQRGGNTRNSGRNRKRLALVLPRTHLSRPAPISFLLTVTPLARSACPCSGTPTSNTQRKAAANGHQPLLHFALALCRRQAQPQMSLIWALWTTRQGRSEYLRIRSGRHWDCGYSQAIRWLHRRDCQPVRRTRRLRRTTILHHFWRTT